MDVSTISILFPYLISGVGILVSLSISGMVWFIIRACNDNKELKIRIDTIESDMYEKYEELQHDNTKIKLQLSELTTEHECYKELHK